MLNKKVAEHVLKIVRKHLIHGARNQVMVNPQKTEEAYTAAVRYVQAVYKILKLPYT
jgi:hypothetical protein